MRGGLKHSGRTNNRAQLRITPLVMEIQEIWNGLADRLSFDLVRECRWQCFIGRVYETNLMPVGANNVASLDLSTFGVKFLAALRTFEGDGQIIRRFLHDNPPRPEEAFDEVRYAQYCDSVTARFSTGLPTAEVS